MVTLTFIKFILSQKEQVSITNHTLHRDLESSTLIRKTSSASGKYCLIFRSSFSLSNVISLTLFAAEYLNTNKTIIV